MLTYLSLGANIGNRESTLLQAVEMIQTRVGNVIGRSSFFYSAAWGYTSEHEFCNICIAVDTTLAPIDLLHTTQQIEVELGRHHKSHTIIEDGKLVSCDYQDRVIDIDILTYEGVTMHTPELTLPHPLMRERDFVLVPLSEICDNL